MDKERWRMELDAATEEKDVVHVARDFIALMSSAELAELPDKIRPRPLRTGDDVAEAAVIYVRAQFEVGLSRERAAVLDAMSEFFSSAAACIARLRSRGDVTQRAQNSPQA
jgi:hypothetical protein